MNPTFAGLWCIFSEPFVDDPVRIDEIVRLLTDPRWPWQPQLLSASSIPGGPRTAQVKGKIRRADLAGAIRAALCAPSTASILFTCSKLNDANHATVALDTGRFAPGPDKVKFTLRAHLHVDALPAGTSPSSWIPLWHDLVRAVRGVHAVIPVTASRYAMSDELYLSTTNVNGRLQHPDAMEIQRIHRHRRDIGATCVRPPRWGNYLPPYAVEAAGGHDAIAAAVEPAVLTEVGSLLYVQLSAIEEALSAATREKQEALAKLLAPVMVRTT